MPALLQAAGPAAAAAVWPGSTGPKRSATVPVWTITPGAPTVAARWAAPPTRRRADDGTDALDAVDAVLQRNDRAAVRQQRAQAQCRLPRCPRA